MDHINRLNALVAFIEDKQSTRKTNRFFGGEVYGCGVRLHKKGGAYVESGSAAHCVPMGVIWESFLSVFYLCFRGSRTSPPLEARQFVQKVGSFAAQAALFPQCSKGAACANFLLTRFRQAFRHHEVNGLVRPRDEHLRGALDR